MGCFTKLPSFLFIVEVLKPWVLKPCSVETMQWESLQWCRLSHCTPKQEPCFPDDHGATFQAPFTNNSFYKHTEMYCKQFTLGYYCDEQIQIIFVPPLSLYAFALQWSLESHGSCWSAIKGFFKNPHRGPTSELSKFRTTQQSWGTELFYGHCHIMVFWGFAVQIYTAPPIKSIKFQKG